MARIPKAEIERLKEAVPVARLVKASGIEPKKGGKDLLGRCPFHEDATASLVVTPAKILWHCFGCGVGGGPIDWVMNRQEASFRHAVELLKADAGRAELGTPTPRTRAKLPAPVSLERGLVGQSEVILAEALIDAMTPSACCERWRW
jgi:DNA primase